MEQILNKILDRTMIMTKDGVVGDVVDKVIDRAIEEATEVGKRQRKSRRKKKKIPDALNTQTCCNVAVCSPPDSPTRAIADVTPPSWVLDERTLATIAASELRRAILRLRHCKHWQLLHSACDCQRQRKNQWRSWDLHTHYCPKIGMPQYLEEEIRDDLAHLDELFAEHLSEMNENSWPAAYDLQCTRGRPDPHMLCDPWGYYTSSSSSSSGTEYPVSTTSFQFKDVDSHSGSAESAVREIIFDILTGLREAPSSDSGGHWGDTGDYDERSFDPWQNDPEPVKEKGESDESQDVVEVGFVQRETPGGEYYGPGPDGTRARPDPPPPAAPFDASLGDDPLDLEF